MSTQLQGRADPVVASSNPSWWVDEFSSPESDLVQPFDK